MTDHTALKEAAEAADSQTTERGKEIDKILWSSARELENIGLRGLSSKLGMDVPSWIKNLQESYLNACQSFDDVSDQNAALLAENEALREALAVCKAAMEEFGSACSQRCILETMEPWFSGEIEIAARALTEKRSALEGEE